MSCNCVNFWALQLGRRPVDPPRAGGVASITSAGSSRFLWMSHSTLSGVSSKGPPVMAAVGIVFGSCCVGRYFCYCHFIHCPVGLVSHLRGVLYPTGQLDAGLSCWGASFLSSHLNERRAASYENKQPLTALLPHATSSAAMARRVAKKRTDTSVLVDEGDPKRWPNLCDGGESGG